MLFWGLLIWIFSFHTEPPPIIQRPNNVTVTPGERAVLTCLVISAVDYNLTWQRNDRDVRLADPARMQILANLSLELRTVKFTDAGEYRCLVSNEGGSSAASVFLTVQGTVLTVTSAWQCLSPSLLNLCSLKLAIWERQLSTHIIKGWMIECLWTLSSLKLAKLETKTSLINTWL